MDNNDKQYAIWLDGQKIPVSEDVYREYTRFERKERYFTKDLKAEHTVIDQEAQTVKVIPSREDSYERLLETNRQFSSPGKTLEETAVLTDMLERLTNALHTLTDEELQLIEELFFLERTERQVASLLHLTQNTVNYRKNRVLNKLRKMIEK